MTILRPAAGTACNRARGPALTAGTPGHHRIALASAGGSALVLCIPALSAAALHWVPRPDRAGGVDCRVFRFRTADAMMRGSPVVRSARGRPAPSGAPLVRLLARLAEVDASAPRHAFADRLSHWLGWTDAIALSAALSAPVAASGARPERARIAGCAFARQRDALVRAMSDDELREPRPAERTRGARGTPVRAEPVDADFPSHRRRYLAKQQAMEAGVGALREGLRAALTARSAALARLAAVDAVMEQVLGERERSLLALPPVVLAMRFERLRQDELAAKSAAPVADDPPPGDVASREEAPATLSGAWLATFRKDMHGVLLAELDLRLQPVEGLIEALDAPA